VRRRAHAARTFELSDIDAVVGGERLVMRLRDGTSATLPACPPDRDHRALAHAVEERIAEVRAAHAGTAERASGSARDPRGNSCYFLHSRSNVAAMTFSGTQVR
jgi:hypothetical protein